MSRLTIYEIICHFQSELIFFLIRFDHQTEKKTRNKEKMVVRFHYKIITSMVIVHVKNGVFLFLFFHLNHHNYLHDNIFNYYFMIIYLILSRKYKRKNNKE